LGFGAFFGHWDLVVEISLREVVMTRETKIGLLVGLAFIIVIGILLSDHLTSSTEPPPAQLMTTANDVRSTVIAPGNVQNNAPVVIAPRIQPQQQVPTPRDFQRQTPAEEVVKINVGGSSLNSSQGSPQPAQAPVAVQSEPPVRFTNPPPIHANENASGLARIAEVEGEPIMSMTPNGSTQNLATAASVANDSNSREYVAQPGDSLSKITAKVFGTSTKAGQDAIVALNPSLQQNRNLITAGKTYRIPTNATVSNAAQAPQQAPAPTPAAAPAVSAQKPSQTASANSSTGVWYTVKEGDTLTRIANEELGDPNAIEAIKALNHDTLPNPNILQINQKIRLPSKPVAIVN
jgi:nucleoid-associated protein YgaU